MRLLVTRPAPDAAELTAALTARGHIVQLEPLLDIRNRPGIDLPLTGVTALVFTSANGVRAFCSASGRRDFPVYAVGDRTAQVSAAAGFAVVKSADGDVESLVALIAATHRSGKLLHPTGTVTAGDLAGKMRTAGHSVDSVALYEAVPATSLTAETRDSLTSGQLEGVLLFSPRTARQWTNLLGQAGLSSAAQQLDAWCLSEAVAVELGSVEYRSVRRAERPTQASLLAALDMEAE